MIIWSMSPILLSLARDCRRFRVFDLEPMGRPPGPMQRAERTAGTQTQRHNGLLIGIAARRVESSVPGNEPRWREATRRHATAVTKSASIAAPVNVFLSSSAAATHSTASQCFLRSSPARARARSTSTSAIKKRAARFSICKRSPCIASALPNLISFCHRSSPANCNLVKR
jgi:hypothetical protein